MQLLCAASLSLRSPSLAFMWPSRSRISTPYMWVIHAAKVFIPCLTSLFSVHYMHHFDNRPLGYILLHLLVHEGAVVAPVRWSNQTPVWPEVCVWGYYASNTQSLPLLRSRWATGLSGQWAKCIASQLLLCCRLQWCIQYQRGGMRHQGTQIAKVASGNQLLHLHCHVWTRGEIPFSSVLASNS